MASARDNPKLYKDIWLHVILPLMDEGTLLDFSSASKETRQLAFAELCGRRDFKLNISNKIGVLRGYDEDHYEYLYGNSLWGKQGYPYGMRLGQLWCMGLATSLSYLNLCTDKYICDRPLFTELTKLSPILSDGILILIVLSFILRQIFLYINGDEIRKYHWERERIEAADFKAGKLKYLIDVLPKQTVSTHSLFRKFIDTSAEPPEASLRCTIL